MEFIKAEKVVGALIGALRRETVLPQLIWLDPAGDFKGAKGDTITLRIPAVTSARKRGLRSGATRTRDGLAEGTVAVTLTTNLYKDVEITDAELTLDIEDFGAQVLQPISAGMVQGWEDEVADLMGSATYAKSVAFDPDDPQRSFARAGKHLNMAFVPQSGRVAVVGANIAEDIITSDQARRADSAGDSGNAALREAMILPLAGFGRILVSAALDPDEGFAFHRTAYAGSSKVPQVPEGVPWGTTMSKGGFAMRAIRAFDPSADAWQDILGFDSFVGTNIVQDHGEFDDDGRWVAAEEPDNENGTDLQFIRAVKITRAGS
jgi:hypothetical protein